MPPAPNFYIKQGSQLPSIRSSIQEIVNGSPSPMNLSVATVEFRMSAEIGQPHLFQSAAIVEAPASDGVVKYDWALTDTLIPGIYYAEWVIMIDGDVAVAPTIGYIIVEVVPSLIS